MLGHINKCPAFLAPSGTPDLSFDILPSCFVSSASAWKSASIVDAPQYWGLQAFREGEGGLIRADTEHCPRKIRCVRLFLPLRAILVAAKPAGCEGAALLLNLNLPSPSKPRSLVSQV